MALIQVGGTFGAATNQPDRKSVDVLAIVLLLSGPAALATLRRQPALTYVMLALAVVIALMGIANTLSLSIHERTREIGVLRAVGETRSQVRSMVRWESVIIATFGTLGSLCLGVFLAWALVQAASGADFVNTFAAPVVQLAVVLVVGALAGVIAGPAIGPPRGAARRPRRYRDGVGTRRIGATVGTGPLVGKSTTMAFRCAGCSSSSSAARLVACPVCALP